MSGRRILVVEDDEDIAEALGDLLTDAGHEVRRAANGKAAFELLSVEPLPELIFLDLMMPVMDGTQFRRLQREDPRLRGIPVVLLSADRRLAQLAKELGVADWLQKPTTEAKLLEVIARVAKR